MTIPEFVIKKKGTRHGALHGKSHHQTRDCLRKAKKNNFDAILQRFPQSETYTHSQIKIRWDEGLCIRLDRVAHEDHSYIATWDEGRRYEKNWKRGLNTLGPVGPMKSRSDYSETVQKIREIRRVTGQELDPAILPTQQVRQRLEQSFPKSETWTVDPRTGWISWSSPEPAPSSTTWWKPFTWWSFPIWDEHRARISGFFSRFSLAGNSDSFVNDGW